MTPDLSFRPGGTIVARLSGRVYACAFWNPRGGYDIRQPGRGPLIAINREAAIARLHSLATAPSIARPFRTGGF